MAKYTSKRAKNGFPNLSRTWLISVYSSFDWNKGLHRLKIECATCSTPLLAGGFFGCSLETRSYKRWLVSVEHDRIGSLATYIHKGVPSLPEVTVRNHTDCLSQLRLDTRRDRNHQTDQLLLNGRDLLQLQFVVSIFICPVSLDEVFKAQGACQASIVGERSGRGDVEKLQRKTRFLFFLTKSKFG